MKPLPILEFIEKFKLGWNKEELIKVFTMGNCYHFAIILNNIYSGDIVYDEIEGHFMFKCNSKYYDITGEVEDVQDIMPFYKIKENDELLYNRLMRDCVYLRTR